MTTTPRSEYNNLHLFPNAPRQSRLVGPTRSRIDPAVIAEPGFGEISLFVLQVGVCASDLPLWISGPPTEAPVALGHEPVGRVIAVGAGVEDFAVGDLVTGRLVPSFADVTMARADEAVHVPPGLSLDEAIGEPLGCVVEAVRRSQVDVGDRIAIVGLGFMGLILLQILATGGVSDLVAIDPREEAREIALQHGATEAYSPSAIPTIAEMTDQFDLAFEVSGTASGLSLATTLAREQGKLSIIGYHQGTRVVDMQAWNWKALEVINGHVRDQRRLVDSTRRGLALVQTRKIRYGELFTHHYTLAEMDTAYAELQSKPPGFVKAVVTMSPGDSPA